LLPLGCEAPTKQGSATQPSGDKSPRHKNAQRCVRQEGPSLSINRPNTGVGVSLLAIAVRQPTAIVAVPPTSRAGSLPQDYVPSLIWPRQPPQAVARGFIPAGLRSSPKSVNSIFLKDRIGWFGGCYAAQREQAPSPQKRSAMHPAKKVHAQASMCQTPKIRVGASLLAIAVGQPTAMATVPPTSRAGSLPQGMCLA
jgi:hypothetical protein